MNPCSEDGRGGTTTIREGEGQNVRGGERLIAGWEMLGTSFSLTIIAS